MRLVFLGYARVQLREEDEHLECAAMAGAVHATAAVDVFGETEGRSGVADQEARHHEVAAQGENDVRLPGALDFAAVTEDVEQPGEALVFLLLAEESDETVDAVGVDLGEVQLLLADHVERILDDQRGGRQKLLMSGVLGSRDVSVAGDVHSQGGEKLYYLRSMIVLLGRDVHETGHREVASGVVLLLVEQFHHAGIAYDTDRPGEFLRAMRA